MITMSVAKTPWATVIPLVHHFDRLDPSCRRGLVLQATEPIAERLTNPQDKVLRSQGLIEGARNRPFLTERGDLVTRFIVLAWNTERCLIQQPEFLVDLLGFSHSDTTQRLAPLFSVTSASRAALREAARTAASWDWTGLPVDGLTVPDLQRARERGQVLLAGLMAAKAPITLSTALTTLDLPPGLAGRALAWLLSAQVAHLRYDEEEHRLHLGFTPEEMPFPTSVLDLGPTNLPLPVTRPWLIETMQALLIAACDGPIERKATGDLKVKTLARLRERVPPAVTNPGTLILPHDEQIRLGLQCLLSRELLDYDDGALHATDEANDWLHGGVVGQQHAIARSLRDHTGPIRWNSSYSEVAWMLPPGFEAWRQAISDLGPGPVDFDAWCRAVLATIEPNANRRANRLGTLQDLVFRILVPTGLAAFQDGVLALTPAGRWAVGQMADWPLPSAPSPEPALVIQADFTVIFLAPSPWAESVVAQGGERQAGATGTGILYRLTKTCLQRASLAGWTAEDYLNDLQALCSKPIPANVRHEITGWMGSIIHGTSVHGLVVTLPDPASAQRVLALATPRDGARLIAPTILLLNGGTEPSSLFRKARAKGINITSLDDEDDTDRWNDEPED